MGVEDDVARCCWTCRRAGALPVFAFDWLRINGLEVLGMSDPKTFGLGEVRLHGRGSVCWRHLARGADGWGLVVVVAGWCVQAGMTKGELVQGALGDRWLLSAMSSTC